MAEDATPKSMPLSEADLSAATGVVRTMVVAFKSYALYSEGHESARIAMDRLKGRLEAYLANHDDLKLTVERGGLRVGGTQVHQESSGEEGIAALLFRDGVQWINFHSGVPEGEIEQFIAMLNAHRTLSSEAESDIVTALWETPLTHVSYAANDVSVDSEVAFGLSEAEEEDAEEIVGLYAPLAAEDAPTTEDFKVPKEDRPEGAGEAPTDAAPSVQPEGTHGAVRPGELEDALSISQVVTDPAVWTLTPDEAEELREMVYEAENFDITDNVLDLLILVLKEEGELPLEDPEELDKATRDVTAILDFLKEEFQTTLQHGAFRLAFKLLKNIHEIKQSSRTDLPQISPLFDQFFKEVSDPEVLAALRPFWPKIETLDETRMRAFRNYLTLLHPVAVLHFAPLLLQTATPKARRLIMELIASLASRDADPLASLLGGANIPLILHLLDLLKRLKGDRFTDLIMGLTRHPSDKIRKTAIQSLLEKEPYLIDKLFYLVEDPSPTVRWLVLKHLGREKNAVSEGLLLDYLEERNYTLRDRTHLVSCYRALGQCGSVYSIPYLKKALFKGGPRQRLDAMDAIHQEGAAVALATMRDPEAQQVLREAPGGVFSRMRQAGPKG